MSKIKGIALGKIDFSIVSRPVRVHFMYLGPKFFGVDLTFCRIAASFFQSILGITAFQNLLTFLK